MKNICKTAAFGLVAGALALSTGVQAQTMDTPATPTTPMTGTMDGSMGNMSGGMMGGSSSMMTPMPVSGTVLRYYVDRSGYVSAMDVQAADGVKMVRFSPSMAQRVTAMYPVGSQISAYVTSSSMSMGSMTMTNYDLAGLGDTMPTPTSMMMPTMVTDLDVLKATPYVMVGAKSMRTAGKLTGYIPDPMTGDVLALILDKDTLVRVPMTNRLPQASKAPEGVRPLFANADVIAYGYEEAPRYGVVSPYAKRIVATGISVNGRTLGPFGFGRVMTSGRGTLLGFNLNFFGGASPDEVKANNMGYTTYMTPGGMQTTTPAPTTGTPSM